MRYLDSGWRAAAETLAGWLSANLDGRVSEFRFQSGYFSPEPIRLVPAVLNNIAQHGRVHAIIGSNDRTTLGADIHTLNAALSMPNPRAQLRIVSFGSGLYHPKTYHVLRRDGSQAAYVGSANLTGPGSTTNIEAGISLDSSDGDDPLVLGRVSDSVDAWLAKTPADGVHAIGGSADVDALVLRGVLAAVRPAGPPPAPIGGGGDGGGQQPPGPSLRALVRIPAGPLGPATGGGRGPLVGVVQGAGIVAYPMGVLFNGPHPTAASRDARALTGAAIPGNAVGLVYGVHNAIVRKTFGTEGGTSDLNLPLEVLPLFLFGIAGANAQPRADFAFHARYLDRRGREPRNVNRQSGRTNITYVGVGPIAGLQPGHRDLRMLIPAPAKRLASEIRSSGHTLPGLGDFVLLELPTPTVPTVRLSVLDPSSRLHRTVRDLTATTPNVGHGNAWWLPAGISPAW